MSTVDSDALLSLGFQNEQFASLATSRIVSSPLKKPSSVILIVQCAIISGIKTEGGSDEGY